MGVNLKKACETIIEPDAPMALRLQSNLLYGVSRVYTQKWDYLLSDTQAIHTSIRTFLNATKGSQIDKNAGKVRPDQLILADDPAFLVDDPLEPPPLDFDTILDEQKFQRSSQSFLSIRSPKNGSNMSIKSGPCFSLDLPSSNHGESLNSYQLPTNDLFGGLSPTHETDQALINFHDDEQLLFHNDDLFEIDDFGEIRELPTEKQGLQNPTEILKEAHTTLESLTSKIAHDKLPNSGPSHERNIINLSEINETRWLDRNEDYMIENVEPFPVGKVDGVQSLHKNPEGDKELSISAKATQKRKNLKSKNIIIKDEATELKIADIRKMALEYNKSMAGQIELKARTKEIAASKKNALHYIFGIGINNIGENIGCSKVADSLADFSGQALHERILGRFPKLHLVDGKKRSQSESEIEEDSMNKRARNIDLELSQRPFIDNNDILSLHEDEFEYDKSIEVGREAASALKDYPSSGIMPWNMSASVHSRPESSVQRLGNRLTPASPLFGHGGSKYPVDLEKLLEDQNDMVVYDISPEKSKQNYRFSHDNDDVRAALKSDFSQPWQSLQGNSKVNDFGILGPTTEFNTQTATNRQWVCEVLDRESINFFIFLRDTYDKINEILVDNKEENSVRYDQKKLTFSKLIEPEKNSFIIAAQAFYHVLNLANKNVIQVEQENDKCQIGSRIDSEISISII
ncbi:hypothetical protein HI914_02892 [Erysiphe necator]|nr:hypothetical protein HI914_02892 [Erysiphe necator]